MKIPIAKPYFDIEEQQAILEPLKTGWVVQGPKVQEFENMVASVVGVDYAIAVSSCTAALHLALLALGIGPHHEVILPAFTYVATANAIEHAGATPVFCDIDISTFNIDVGQIESRITENTKAIMPVHLFGLTADMGPIMQLSEDYELKVIEDAACALAATYQRQPAGAIGHVGCFSFHPRKLITTGEGGMLTTDIGHAANLLRILRSHGGEVSDAERHKKGEFALSEHNVPGYNYRMTDLQGAIGTRQMNKLDLILNRRLELARTYDKLLEQVEGIAMPFVPEGYKHTYQSYVALVKDTCPLSRDELALRLKSRGIATRQGTHAVHALGYYRRKYNLAERDYPMAWEAAQRSITFPLYPQMTEEEQGYVLNNLKDIIQSA